MKYIKLFENFNGLELPEHIKKDIKGTGYSIEGLHKHGHYYILKLKRDIDMTYDPKDFSRFDWVVDNHSSNNNLDEFKLKIKF